MSTAQQPEQRPERSNDTEPGETRPIDAVRARVGEAGVLARPLRGVLALLATGAHSLDELIHDCAVPRRTVEELLEAAGEDLVTEGESHRLAPAARDQYRERFALDEFDTSPAAPGPDHEQRLVHVREFVESGPAPSAALDHVTATPETVLNRAEWLRDNYDLRGARLLCLGDHDLTSLAVCLSEPSARVTVVDVDERVLAHIDGIAAEHGFDIHTLHTDLRFGLPPAVAGCADLVFTDPPYTPEGAGLFAARAAECLAGANSRLLLAYGFSDRSPALGHKVQQELLRLGMVFEAILPGFHRYYGAQAIGSSSDLYVCQPSARTRKLAGRETTAIYTHGGQSVESSRPEPAPEFLDTLSGLTRTNVTALRGPGWERPLRSNPNPVFDLRADPGPWLLRMLLACNAEHAAFVVGNRHPDITSEHAQNALAGVLRDKYSLRFHRSTPDATHAVVFADPSTHTTGVTRHLLQRAHGKVGNTWREALISEATARGSTLTKREANERVAGLVQHSADLGVRLIDLPRHRLAALLHTEP